MDDRAPSRRRVLFGAASASAVGLASLAGCVGDEAANDADEDAGTDDTADDAEADDDGDGVVEIETREGEDGEPDFVFDPAIAELEPGDTVRWVNTDGVFHTVTSTDSLEARTESDEFNEELAAEGDTFEWTPEEEGTPALLLRAPRRLHDRQPGRRRRRRRPRGGRGDPRGSRGHRRRC
ncbi:hypothetical protein [Natronococcus sp.]|uniref:cupredoxin domain-containing protein n=1 Tax=Natronococcus sp. TaxID=35747 RepID=UPI0025DB6014|nr:hypothetical protein [Natronococcus sp.]